MTAASRRLLPRPALLCGPVAVLVAVGCGGGGADRPAKPLGTAGLKRALERFRRAGPLPVRLQATITRPGHGTQVQLTAKGTLDLAADAGSAELDVPALAGLGTAANLRMAWTASTVKVMGVRTVPRAQAREDGGQAGVLPDELGGMAELVADAQRITERSNGRWTFVVPALTAVARGVPPQPDAGTVWTGEATATSSGRLRTVVLRMPGAVGGGKAPTATLTLELG